MRTCGLSSVIAVRVLLQGHVPVSGVDKDGFTDVTSKKSKILSKKKMRQKIMSRDMMTSDEAGNVKDIFALDLEQR